MTGISYILPLIIGASLVIAVAKICGMVFGVTDLSPYENKGGMLGILRTVENIGWTGIGMMNALLAAFIAYSIGEKPALAAGFIGGQLATNTKSGFLGAVIAGFFAGYVTLWVKKHIKFKRNSLSGMVPLIILPLITVGLTGILTSIILGKPLGAVNTALISWMKHMISSGTSKVIVALVIGAMIGFDLGGPVNKAAWMTCNALFLSGIYLPAIYCNIAIVIPPLGYGFAVFIRKNRFSETLRESGKGSLVMGLIGITEGAIPFTLCNPLKLIPINVIGCALGSVVAAALGVSEKMPPIGGMYGFISVGRPYAYIIGALVGALFIGIVSTLFVNFNADDDEPDGDGEISDDDIQIDF